MKPASPEQSPHGAKHSHQQDCTEHSMENSHTEKTPSENEEQHAIVTTSDMENSHTEKSPNENKEQHTLAATSDAPGPVSAEVSPPIWKAGKGEWLIIIFLAIISLMVAIDATILVTALPVCSPNSCRAN